MAKLRLVHNRTVQGDLLINDIDHGLPDNSLQTSRKQDSYVTYNRKYFVGLGVQEDPNTPGFIDLVLDDAVKLSQAGGTIKGFVDSGLVTAIALPDGAAAAPVITLAQQDRAGGGDATDDWRVIITGTGFTSLAPSESSVVVTSVLGTEVTLSFLEIVGTGGTVSDTQIVITPLGHTFPVGGAEDVDEVEVLANYKTSGPTPVVAL